MDGLLHYASNVMAVDRLGRLGGDLFLITKDASMGTSDMGDKDWYNERFQ